MAFKERLTKPEAGNKYYIRKASGGYSNAIKGNPTDKDCDVLANCVGYAYGRFNEIGNWGSCKYLSPVNAEKFIQYKGTCEVGQTPKLGACMVWQKGATLSGDDGAGHVAIVERIISDTEILTSESGYGSKAFWTQTRKKGTNGNWGQASSYKFLGFIYNPAVKDEEPAPEVVTPEVVEPKKLTLDDFEENEIVKFAGGKHYSSANASSGSTVKASLAKITRKYPSGKHPLHLRAVNESGKYISGVYGWCDLADVSKTTAEAEPEPAKTIDELAREVIAGKWGNGAARKTALTEAGYDYTAVQKRVNELLK